MNNPLNLTDPSGFSWLSKAFSKIGNWIKKNWRTIVVIVVQVVVSIYLGPEIGAAVAAGLNVALNGGRVGDVLKSAAIAYVGAYVGKYGGGVARAAYDGATTEAMGGKFQDGFLTSLKYNTLMETAQIAGKMIMSKFTQQYMTGSRDIVVEEDELLWKSGYDLQAQYDHGKLNPSELNLPSGWKFVKYFRNYEESNLDYAMFENQVKGIRLMTMVGTQTGGDWIDNFLQGIGFKSPQYMAAIKYSLLEQSEAVSAGFQFVLNGHSLGGGVAAAAAAVSGAPAAIFNAAGLHPMTLIHAGYPGSVSRIGLGVVHYGVGGEVLSGLEFTIFSAFVPKPAATHFYSYWPQPQSFSELSPIEWHRPLMTMRSIN
jgi:hypothetical protein